MKHVGEDEFLLDQVKIVSDSREIRKADLKKVVRQKPNTRVLSLARFHLGLYNLSGRDTSRRVNRWLRGIGEPPVVFDPLLVTRSVRQIEITLLNKGYYKASVSDSVSFKKRKARVKYHVHAGPRTLIKQVSFRSSTPNQAAERTGLLDAYYRDTVNTIIHPGLPLDINLLDDERDRVTRVLREKGFYNFSKNFIQFFADSTTTGGEKYQARVFTRISSNPGDTVFFQRYFVRDIRVDMDYDQLATMSGTDTVMNHADHDGYAITYRDKLKINPKVIIETIQINRNELYNIKQVLDTYSRLQGLNLFRYINIEFEEGEGEHPVKPLDCTIRLTPMKRQSYNLSIEGTNTSGNLGIGGNLTYSHRNLFKGGEEFSIGVWGTIKKERLRDNGSVFNTREIGAEMKFVTPQFWMPVFWMKNFRHDHAPRTSLTFSYGFEETPYYTRSIVNTTFGYLWRKVANERRWRYNLNIADLNYVLMNNVDPGFIDSIKNEYIKSAYTDHMILSAVFTASYTNQLLDASRSSYSYFRVNIKSAGNLLWTIDRARGRVRGRGNAGDVYYTGLGVRYAQFLKMDAEYRYHWTLNRVNSLVWRVLIGCGYPYGNMKVLPHEEAFYCGGANDLRAWQLRTLGPGSFIAPDTGRRWYPNSVGDVKLAINAEYRFKLFWVLEGALFLDAGNVWNINSKEDRPATRLTSNFYNQIAIGTGAGLRVNASYFLLRLDLGVKVKDPTRDKGERLVLFNSRGGSRAPVMNIAIGYPF